MSTKPIHELQQRREAILKEQQGMLDRKTMEHRLFSSTEEAHYNQIDRELDELDVKIRDGKSDLERRRKLAEQEVHKSKRGGQADVDPEKEFRNIGEFFHGLAARIKDGANDPRFDSLLEARAQSMGVGAEGGFALPTQFRDEIFQVSPQEAIVRPRATVIPAGSPPDAKLECPALDQSSGSNIYGGVTITHTGEAITMTETSAALRQLTLEPKEMSAYIVTTNKLLNNWEAASTFITTQLRRAIVGAEDYDMLRGDGINKCLGILNAPAAITVTRSAPNVIAFTDVVSMLARAKMGGNLAWVVSQTCIPQLCAMVDAGNHAVWTGSAMAGLPGAAGPLPSSLFGLPVLWGERLPALGTSGDINLVDLQYYLVKDGSGPFAAISTELLFLSNRTVFRIVWNVDARPWLTEPIGLEGSTTSTVSPFVKLS
jgi:HK97 family phage major capsid protein